MTFFPTVTDAWENELVTDLEAMEPLDREELNDLQEFLARPLWRTSVNELYEFAETAGYWGYRAVRVRKFTLSRPLNGFLE